MDVYTLCTAYVVDAQKQLPPLAPILMAHDPEIFFVNSKITDKQKLSPELFTEWYNDVHVPDILVTSGIKCAYRYVTTNTDIDSVDRPYLALYPVRFHGFLQTKEFANIPVNSEKLPGPGHCIFDVADFDARCYRSSLSVNPYAGKFVTVVESDKGPDVQDIITKLSKSPKCSFSSSDCYFARQNRLSPEESQVGTPPSKLLLVWSQTQQEAEDFGHSASDVGRVTQYRLLRAFTPSDTRAVI